MNVLDLMQMAGSSAPGLWNMGQAAPADDPAAPKKKPIGLPGDAGPAVGVGGPPPGPASVGDLTAPTVRSLAEALGPQKQVQPQQPQGEPASMLRVVSGGPDPYRVGGTSLDGRPLGEIAPNLATGMSAGAPIQSYGSGPGAAPGMAGMPGSFEQYLQQQAGKSGMGVLQQASALPLGSDARAKAQQEYSGLLGAQQKFGLDTNQQKIEQQKIAAGLVGIGVSHEGDAAKELGAASKNAYVQANNEVKARGGSDAEADKAGTDRMAQVANADAAFARMKQAAKAGTPAGGVGVAPGAAAPGLPAAPAAPANKGGIVGMETDPLVQGLFQTAGPQGAKDTGVVDNGKLDPEKFLQSYGSVAGKMTPEQKKGVAQALASRMGGAQNASQQMLDALAERQLFGGVPTAGDFSLSKLPNAEPDPNRSFLQKLLPSDANLNAGYQLTAPGFQSKHFIAPNRVATPTLGKTKQRYAQQAPVLADLLSYTLPLTQQ